MAIYMIGYDLHPVKGENYDRLFAALEAMGTGYWDCLDSTWLITTEKTPAQIRDEIKQYLKDDDRLLVMRYGDGAAWFWIQGRMPDLARRHALTIQGLPSSAARLGSMVPGCFAPLGRDARCTANVST